MFPLPVLVDVCGCSGWAREILVRTGCRLRVLWTHCVVFLLALIPPLSLGAPESPAQHTRRARELVQHSPRCDLR